MRISDWSSDVCSSDLDRETRERTYDIFQDIEPRPASARLDGPEGERVLEIVWQGSGHVTRHRLDWVAPYARGLPRRDLAELPRCLWSADRKRGVSGKRVSVSAGLGGRRINKKKKKTDTKHTQNTTT